MLHQATPSGPAEGAKKGQEEWKGGCKSAHTSLDVFGSSIEREQTALRKLNPGGLAGMRLHNDSHHLRR